MGRALVLTVPGWGIQEANASSNLQEHMVQRGKVDKRIEGEGEQGLGTERVPCHHIYGPCEADRINVTPVDKVGAERIRRMN